MFKVVKGLMELVQGRKTSSDLLYQWFACAAAMLTIAAYMRHQRPSDVLAEVTRIFGFESASAWLTTGLPPVLALPNPISQCIIEASAGVLLMVMLFLPFRVARREERSVEWQAQGLLGAHAPGTVWIFLMAASQLGPLDWFVVWLLSAGVLLFLAALIISGLLCLAAWVFSFRDPLASSFQKFPLILCDVVSVVSMVISSFLFAAVAPLVDMIVWVGSIESGSFFKANLRAEIEKGERRRPTGAKPSS